ncbi:MAG TPA: aminopeptidase P N-terminal domain-containing protein [Gemmatimonadales bacterium]|nr:aminopeptidase P N-terminal domain-containing protein [Gemmatimonadales bacterium]
MRIAARFVTALLLFTAGPLTAQITREEYAARRDSLAARIGDGILVAFGGVTPVSDFGPFFQLPAFRYLTGYEFTDAALVMVAQGGRGRSTLFVKRTAPRTSLYYGAEPDSVALARDLDLASRPIDQVAAVVDSLIRAGARRVYAVRDFAAADFARQDSLTRGGQFVKALGARHAGLEIHDAHPLLDQLRARKTEAELALIRKAAEISAAGHTELMRRIGPGMHEYDLQAIIEHEFRRGGAERPAYGSIVGSGPLSLQLHYMRNRRAMQPGDVVVIDAGAEYRGYTADVTRTLPVGGTYSPEQRAVYQIVRDAQAAAERNSKAGMSIRAALDSSIAIRARGLAGLGLIESPEATLDLPWPANCSASPWACRQVTLFTIHGITHGIGLEVHDPIQAYQDGVFKVGDAFVIEPGVYISPKLLDMLPDTPKNRAFVAKVRRAVERYANTGVRIEDSYVLTERGLERISLAPREIDEIEALTRRRAPVP